jgi:hypothetical protein
MFNAWKYYIEKVSECSGSEWSSTLTDLKNDYVNFTDVIHLTQ